MKWASSHEMLTPDEAACDPLPMWVADTGFSRPLATDSILPRYRHSMGY